MPNSGELKLPQFDTDLTPGELEWARNDLRDPENRIVWTYNFSSIPGAQVFTVIHNYKMGMFNESAMTIGGTKVVGWDEVWTNLGKHIENLIPELARDMTYKWIILSSMLNDNPEATEEEKKAAFVGGGRSAIILPDMEQFKKWGEGEELHPNRHDLFQEYATFLNKMGGSFVTGIDMYVTFRDMNVISETSQHVIGQDAEHGGIGDPSPVAALGTFYGAVAMLEERKKVHSEDIGPEDATYLVQGVGKGGAPLVDYIFENFPNARVVISDTSKARLAAVAEKHASNFGKLKLVLEEPGGDSLLDHPGDIYLPCAGSNTLTWRNLERLSEKGVRVVAGLANDIYPMIEGQPDPQLVQAYNEKGIWVAPAPAVNLGAILTAAIKGFVPGMNSEVGDERVRELIKGVDGLVRRLVKKASENNTTLEEAFTDEVVEFYARYCKSNGLIEL